MEYFAGLDISMDETHVCVVDREGVVIHESKSASLAGGDRRRTGESAKLPSDRFRDRTHGADPAPRVEPAWSSRWSASRADRPTRRSSHLPPTRPTAMTREGWRIWPALASSSPCT